MLNWDMLALSYALYQQDKSLSTKDVTPVSVFPPTNLLTQSYARFQAAGKQVLLPRFIDMDSHQGYTALHIAASHGHLETTLVLLKYGASLTYECEGTYQRPNSQIQLLMSRAHVTALHIAAARRNISMCRAMLQTHASLLAISFLLVSNEIRS